MSLKFSKISYDLFNHIPLFETATGRTRQNDCFLKFYVAYSHYTLAGKQIINRERKRIISRALGIKSSSFWRHLRKLEYMTLSIRQELNYCYIPGYRHNGLERRLITNHRFLRELPGKYFYLPACAEIFKKDFDLRSYLFSHARAQAHPKQKLNLKYFKKTKKYTTARRHKAFVLSKINKFRKLVRELNRDLLVNNTYLPKKHRINFSDTTSYIKNNESSTRKRDSIGFHSIKEKRDKFKIDESRLITLIQLKEPEKEQYTEKVHFSTCKKITVKKELFLAHKGKLYLPTKKKGTWYRKLPKKFKKEELFFIPNCGSQGFNGL